MANLALRAEVERLTYAPGQLMDVEEKGVTCFNLWSGWGTAPKKGDVKPFLALVDHIFTGAEPDAAKWFVLWLAYPLQHPGTKLHTAVVMWSPIEGVGKSMFGYTMKRIYGDNFVEIGQGHLGTISLLSGRKISNSCLLRK